MNPSRIDPHAGRARGVSLIELMVALVLGLIVTGSALTLVMTQRQTFTATEDLGQVQQGVRLAFELLSRELRNAGSNPCDNGLDIRNGLNDPTAFWWANWSDLATPRAPGLVGYGGGTAFPDAAFGVGTTDRVAGRDAIEVKAAVPVSADVALLIADLGTPIELTAPLEVSSTVGVELGDLLMICNFNNASIFRVTSVDADSIGHSSVGTDPSGNASDEMPRADENGYANFNVGSVIAKVHAARWYIGNNGEDTDNDGAADGRSLYRAMLVNNGGTLGVDIDEVARGITDMQVEYLVRGQSNYVDAAAIDFIDADRADPVIGVRIHLTLSGDDRIGPNGERIVRVMTHTVAIRGAAE